MLSQAIILNGSTQYGQVANFAGIDAMTDGRGTVEGWFWNDPGSSPYSTAISVDKTDDTSTTSLSTENGTGNAGVNFKYDYGAGTDADGWAASGVFTASTWMHVAQVWTANNKTKIYSNGVEISYNAQVTPVGTPTTWDTMPLNIGFSQRITPDPKWTGRIGGYIRLWNTAKTVAEIKANKDVWMNATKEAGLVINLNFQEGSGATISNDASPANVCNLTGSPTWTTGPSQLTPKIYKYSFQNNLRPKIFAPGLAR